MSIMRVLLGKCNRAFDERLVFLMNDMVLHKKARGAARVSRDARHSQYTGYGIRNTRGAAFANPQPPGVIFFLGGRTERLRGLLMTVCSADGPATVFN